VKEGAYQKALAFKPNIVIIMLGTNDTKPKNWPHADDFTADYRRLIETFQKLDSKPKVILCTPVPAYPENFGISDERIRTGVKPKVEELGKELELPVIDLYAAMSNKKELFPDKIHPNAEGATRMAETIAAALGVK
jgi:lysophospholipase L1-like esterase